MHGVQVVVDHERLITDMLAGTPGMTRYTASLFADSATDTRVVAMQATV